MGLHDHSWPLPLDSPHIHSPNLEETSYTLKKIIRTLYGWLSKFLSLFLGTLNIRWYPKWDHNFDNHPYCISSKKPYPQSFCTSRSKHRSFGNLHQGITLLSIKAQAPPCSHENLIPMIMRVPFCRSSRLGEVRDWRSAASAISDPARSASCAFARAV